ncbi:hypothetical protein AXG93_2838s1010 [Marchantia polymorpha subsp. ruderalis]|uniref:Uncharacterized protein n=1 Tax=Marchantia polymorpha subsp. ruderalis TaxID=1480154 RepID=A0A176VMF1_MARPO|nr:hypothetical protein AXG93_2838s1010 [Marchantia polymorpha subsp. ruderalis]
MYNPDIKDKVNGLLREELSKVTTPKKPKKVPAKSKPMQNEERSSRAPKMLRDPHYDIAADPYERGPNITFRLLLKDNKTYRKMLNIALKRPKKTRAHKLPRVYQVLHEDLTAPEIDIEICGFTIRKVPLDSGSDLEIPGSHHQRGPKITVPWVKIPHEGETQSTSSRYTLEEDT